MAYDFDSVYRRGQEDYGFPQEFPSNYETKRPKNDRGFFSEALSVTGDLLAAPFRGAEGMVQGAYNLADAATFDILPDYDERMLGESEYIAGTIVESISQFALGFGAAGKALGTVGKFTKMNRFAKATVQGAATDFAFFDGHEARLSNAIQGTALANPITEFLEADEDDHELLGRLKASVEGAGLGAAWDSISLGVRRLKAYRRAKTDGLDDAGTRAAVDAVEDATGRATDEAGGEVLDDPSTPLTAVTEKYGVGMEDVEEVLNTASYLDDVGVVEKMPKEMNVSRWADPDGRKGLTRALTEKFRDEMDRAASIGTETLEETRAKAINSLSDMVVVDSPVITDSLIRAAGKDRRALADIGPRAAAYRWVYEYASSDTMEQLRRVVSQGATDEDRLDVIGRFEALVQFQGELRGIAQESGRLLGTFRINGLDGTISEIISRGGKLSAEIATDVVDAVGRDAFDSFSKKALAAYDKGGLDGIRGLSEMLSIPLQSRIMRITTEHWMNGILSGPQTWTVNLISGVAMSVYEPMERMAGSFLSADMDGVQDAISELSGLWQATRESAKLGWLSGKEGQTYLTPRSKLEYEASASIKAGMVGLEDDSSLGKMVNAYGKFVRTPGRILTATDEFLKQANYRAEAWRYFTKQARESGVKPADMGAYAHKKMNEFIREGAAYNHDTLMREGFEQYRNATNYAGGVMDERRATLHAIEYAKENFDEEFGNLAKLGTEKADRRTFTNKLTGKDQGLVNNSIDKLALLTQSAVQEVPLLRFTLPFIRTPTNILKFVLDRSPVMTFPATAEVAMVKMKMPMFSKARSKMAKELMSPDRAVSGLAKSKLAMSASLAGAAFTAAHTGMLSGRGPAKREDRDALLASGWQPYSVRIPGGKWVSYRRMDPFASMLGIVADISDYMKFAEMEPGENSRFTLMQSAVMAAMFQSITEKSYLTGLENLIGLMSDPDRNAEKFVNRFAGSFVPSIAAQSTAAFGDDTVREVHSMSDAMLRRIPEFSEDLEPRRNLLGEPVKKLKSAGSDTLGAWMNAWMPVQYQDISDDLVNREIGQLKYGFTPPHTTWKNHDLLGYRSGSGQSAFDRWGELHGQVRVGGKNLRDALKSLMTSEAYQRLSPESTADMQSPRIPMVSRILQRYRRAALRQLMSEYPALQEAETLRRTNVTKAKQGANPLDLLLQ